MTRQAPTPEQGHHHLDTVGASGAGKAQADRDAGDAAVRRMAREQVEDAGIAYRVLPVAAGILQGQGLRGISEAPGDYATALMLLNAGVAPMWRRSASEREKMLDEGVRRFTLPMKDSPAARAIGVKPDKRGS